MDTEKYFADCDIHRNSYTYYKKSEIDLAIKNLKEGKNGSLIIYNAKNDEIVFKKEYSSDRYFRRFKDANWMNFNEFKESINIAIEMRKELENGDFN